MSRKYIIGLVLAAGTLLHAQSPDFYKERAYPNGVPADALTKAWKQRQALDQAASSARGQATGQIRAAFDAPSPLYTTPAPPAYWVPIGLLGITSASGPLSGRVTSLATNPNFPNAVYLAAAGGGVWRSLDAGDTWQAAGDNLLSMSSGTLALDPRTGKFGTLYYGTGDYAADLFSWVYGAGQGILSSTDGGYTWQQLGTQFSGGNTLRIALSPTDTKTLFAARDSGVWRTTDGGKSWSNTLKGFATDVVTDAVNPALVFAALGDVSGSVNPGANGVYRSVDGGLTWTLIQGLPSGLAAGRISLAKTAANSGTICALISSYNDFSLTGLYRSDDSGGNWRKLDGLTPLLFYSNTLNQQIGWYDQLLAIDPLSADNIYVGGQQLYGSNDGGNSWNALSQAADGTQLAHPAMFSLAFQPNTASSGVFLGTEGGVYRSVNSGNYWFNINNGLSIAQLNSVAVSAGASTVLASAESSGALALTGQLTNWSQMLAGDTGTLIQDPFFAGVLYATQQNLQPLRSTDGGNSWGQIASGINPTDGFAVFPPMIADPNTPGGLLFGTTRVYRSNDQGSSWTPVSSGLDSKGYWLTALAVVPGTGRTYAASFTGNVYYSADGATNWKRGLGLPAAVPTSITPDPSSALGAYVTISGFGHPHVLHTQDGGATWQDITYNLPDAPASALVIDPRGPIYVATDVGVFRNADGNSQWTSFNQGLPNTFISSLALDPTTNVLVAGTYGRGAFETSLQSPGSPAPSIVAGVNGIVDAASGATLLAPGTVAILYGANLAQEADDSTTVPVPVLLGGTRVTVNGVAAPLFHVEPGYIKFQVPFQTTSSGANIAVTTAHGSAGAFVQIAPAAPGIASVYRTNGQLVSEGNPTTAGEVIIIYADGLGDTTPGSVTGAPAPNTPSPLSNAVTATIGGVAASVQFAGLSPGSVGLYQVNVQVPAGVTGNITGNILLTLSSAGRASNTVTITVR